MTTATVVLDSAQAVAPVQRRVFGSFIEHLGRCVYTGIYEPGHPTADGHGLRGDVLALFCPFATTARLSAGVVLSPRVESGTYATGRHGEAPPVDAVATHGADAGSAAVFLVNRSREATTVRIDVGNLGVGDVREALTLADADPYAANTREHPDRVGLRPVTAVLTEGVVSVELPRSPGRPFPSADPGGVPMGRMARVPEP